eukprot:TRINITY_DN25550_c0_g1_i1.p1 TRINITY_DN25550_c0_g1~~TRINITY_DN25550_c0_g1_i1.p1  ORF type:complete len:349 (-),score=71.17 TRINITY_DN25550_c0_g1_i1:58-1104(-)
MTSIRSSSMSSEGNQLTLSEENSQTQDPLQANGFRHKSATCSVASCPSPADASYHKFPKEPSLLKKWIEPFKMKSKFNAKTCRICCNHFSEDCWERDLRNELLGLKTRRILKKGACPTIDVYEAYIDEEIEDVHRPRRRKKIHSSESSESKEGFEEDEDETTDKSFEPSTEIDPQDSNTESEEGSVYMEEDEPITLEPQVILKTNPQDEDEKEAPHSKSISKSAKQEILALKRVIRRLNEGLSQSRRKSIALKKELKRLNSKKYKNQLLQDFLEKSNTPAQAKQILNPQKKHFQDWQEDNNTTLALSSLNNKASSKFTRKAPVIQYTKHQNPEPSTAKQSGNSSRDES